MKNYLSLFVCLLFTTIAIGQEVSTKQYSFMAKKTADWCPRCGDWGWTYYKSLIENNGNGPYLSLALHFSGGLSDPTAQVLAANYGGSSQPLFWLNNTEIIVLSNTVPESITSTQEKINAKSKISPEIGVGIDAQYSDNKIEIKVKAKALQDPEVLDYYLGVYFVKNHLIAPQASQSNSADHLNVLDRKATPDHFGVRIFDALSNEDDEFKYETTLNNITPHTSNIADMKVAAIVWQKDNAGQYHFVNGNIVEVSELTSALEDQNNELLSYDLNSKENSINLQFSSDVYDKVDALVYDVKGGLINSKLHKISNRSYTIETNSLTSGIYFVQVAVNNKVSTKQVFISN